MRSGSVSVFCVFNHSGFGFKEVALTDFLRCSGRPLPQSLSCGEGSRAEGFRCFLFVCLCEGRERLPFTFLSERRSDLPWLLSAVEVPVAERSRSIINRLIHHFLWFYEELCVRNI